MFIILIYNINLKIFSNTIFNEANNIYYQVDHHNEITIENSILIVQVIPLNFPQEQ